MILLLELFLKGSQPLACCQRRLDRATNPSFNYNCLPHHLHRIDLNLEFPFNCIILNLIHLTNEQLQKFSFLLLLMFWTKELNMEPRIVGDIEIEGPVLHVT